MSVYGIYIYLCYCSTLFVESDDDTHLPTKYVTVIPVGQRLVPEQDLEASRSTAARRGTSLLNGHSQSRSLPNGLNVPPEIILTSESDSEIDLDLSPGRSVFSMKSGDSFNTRALTALKELDAAMAAEVSDIETGTGHIVSDYGANQGPDRTTQTKPTQQNGENLSRQISLPPPGILLDLMCLVRFS